MNDTGLDRECLAFSAYLIGQRPDGYVLAKYREAHVASGIVGLNEGRFLDRLLVGVAAAHPAGAKLVDAYTAVFYKKSVVRRKWILLLAIFESCAPTYKYFDNPDAGGRARLAALLLWQGLIFILAFIISIILFMPAHLITERRRDGGTERQRDRETGRQRDGGTESQRDEETLRT